MEKVIKRMDPEKYKKEMREMSDACQKRSRSRDREAARKTQDDEERRFWMDCCIARAGAGAEYDADMFADQMLLEFRKRYRKPPAEDTKR